MTKHIAVALILFAFFGSLSAQKYVAVSSEISFFSAAPLENISARNKDGKSILNTATKEVAFVVAISGFHFEKPLMEEHFNEKYMESDKFKTALFKAKINEDIDFLKEGTYQASVSGKLTIHGVEQERTIQGTITIKGNRIIIDAKFPVKVVDHKIEIPKLVFKNIAEVVETTVHIEYEPKREK